MKASGEGVPAFPRLVRNGGLMSLTQIADIGNEADLIRAPTRLGTIRIDGIPGQ